MIQRPAEAAARRAAGSRRLASDAEKAAAVFCSGGRGEVFDLDEAEITDVHRLSGRQRGRDLSLKSAASDRLGAGARETYTAHGSNSRGRK